MRAALSGLILLFKSRVARLAFPFIRGLYRALLPYWWSAGMSAAVSVGSYPSPKLANHRVTREGW